MRLHGAEAYELNSENNDAPNEAYESNRLDKGGHFQSRAGTMSLLRSSCSDASARAAPNLTARGQTGLYETRALSHVPGENAVQRCFGDEVEDAKTRKCELVVVNIWTGACWSRLLRHRPRRDGWWGLQRVYGTCLAAMCASVDRAFKASQQVPGTPYRRTYYRTTLRAIGLLYEGGSFDGRDE